MKIKNQKNFFIKSTFSVLLFIFSFSSFANDRNATENKNMSVKVEKIKFTDNSIVSGKQEAIKRTNAIFDYTDNSIYEIYAKLNYLITLRLQEGEKIKFFAGGDTERWDIEESEGGKGNRPIIFIKPSIENDEDDMYTNIIIVTDKHTYFLNVYLSDDKYNPLVEWRYPNERKIILEAQEKNTTIGTDDLTKLNYNYNWNKNQAISPVQVFDNGEHTIITMKNNLKEMPAVFIRGIDKQNLLITPKIKGNYITIDRITDEITLRLGKANLKIYNKNFQNKN